MKKFIVLLIISLAINACSTFIHDKNIETVKHTSLISGFDLVNQYKKQEMLLESGFLKFGLNIENNGNVAEFLNEIAGIDGDVKWKSFSPTGYEKNPNIVCVQVDITRTDIKNNKLIIQFLLNTSTAHVKLYSIEIDGKSVSDWDFYLAVMEIGLSR